MSDDLVVTRFEEPKKAKPQKKKQGLSAQCDVLAGRIARSQGFCDACGKTSDLQWAHGFSRRYRNTRWLAEANFVLCKGCHMYWTHRPIEWDEWLRARWGEAKYAELRALALSDDKAHKPVLKTVLADLTERWERIQRAYGEAS